MGVLQHIIKVINYFDYVLQNTGSAGAQTAVLQQEIKVINYFDYVLQNTLWVNGIWKGFM